MRTGRSGPCTDAGGGSEDLSNGGLAEELRSDLHQTSCCLRQEFTHALTLYYWLRKGRVYTHAQLCRPTWPYVRDRIFACERTPLAGRV